MTALSNRRDATSAHELSGALIDQLAETVTLYADSHSRSLVIAALTAEVFETVRWMQGSEPEHEELASLYRVLAEAYAHRSRMAARAVVHHGPR